VTDVIASGSSRDEVLRLAAVIEKNSEHPLGEAIVRGARERGLTVTDAESFSAIPGYGVEATFEGRALLLGNRKLMAERGVDIGGLVSEAERLEQEGKTAMFLAADDRAAGIVAVADTLKPTSQRAVAELHRMGLEVVMITGDNRRTAEAIARQVNIDRVLAEVLPQEKAEKVKGLQAEGKRVAMVGDGVNDAPALALSSVGIAMGAAGSPAAIETADIALMTEDLRRIPAAVVLGRRMVSVIRQNVAASLAIKAGFLAMAVAGYATLWMAVVADMGTTLLVIGNGLRLLRNPRPPG